MTRDKLQNIFRQPFSMQVWQEILMNLFGATEVRTAPTPIESDNKNVVKGEFIGELNTSDRFAIGIFSFEVNENTKIGVNRVGLRKLVHSYAKCQYDAVIAVFYNDSQWRLSFICDLKAENTSPKRYTYVFGNETENYRTAAEQLIKLYDSKPTFENIKDAFSVDKLSKDFFKEYKIQYSKFITNIGDTKQNRDYVKKMMGRLVFLQFLQKKGWMGVPADQDNWHGGDIQYTQNLIKKYEGDKKLLTNVLEKLFFDTLNTKRPNDIADSKLGDNIKIPYLNGGLFDRDDLDKKDIDFPYDYFTGLMEFFSHYNFTIDENDPYDAEVGIDPEMLGHIFENLLEDNKDKGAFYTPKEIVQYMCRQSLIEYLQSKLGKHESIATLINQHQIGDVLDKSNFVAQNAAEISRLLDNVKICDPAIGSGAFPMGLLNEIFHTKLTLNSELNERRAEVKKNIIQNSIYGVDIEQGAVDIARLRFWLSLVVDEGEPQPLPNLDYKIVCGNSLLSRHALDTPINEVFAEYNRENKTKFTLGDYKALVADYTNTSNRELKDNFRATIEQIKRAFKSSLDGGLLKKRIKLEGEITAHRAVTLFGAASKEDLKLAKEKGKRLATMLQNEADITTNKLYANAFEWRFEFPALLDDDGSFTGFDIVIGNPPYVQLQANGGFLAEQLDNANYETFARTGDIYCLFYERGVQLLCDGGIETYITSNKWMRAGYGEKTRAYFAKNNPLKLLDLGAGVFESATVDTNILVIQKGANRNELQAVVSNKTDFLNIHFSPMNISNGDIWTVLSPIEQTIKSKIQAVGTPLKDWDIEIYRGVLTGYNEAFIIDTAKRDEILSNCVTDEERLLTEELIKPILRGRDIKRYSTNWAGLWLVNTHNGVRSKNITPIDINNYPAVKAHLDNYSEQLNKRQDKGITPYNLRNCAYLEEFKKEKIVWIEICDKSQFHLDTEGYNNEATSFFLSSKTTNLRYLLAILNSKIINYVLRNTTAGTGMGTSRWKKVYVQQFPIPQIPEEDQQPFIDIVDQILEAKRESPTADTTALEAQIDTMVYALYNLTEEEITIIQNK